MFLLTVMAAVLCSSSEVRGRVVIVQEGALSAVPGASVRLSCRVHPEVYDNIRLAWYHQADGGPPRPLLLLSRQRAPGVPERIAGGGKNQLFHLNISDVQPDDAGVYYCQSRHFLERQDVFTFGAGTRLDVGAAVRPSLTLLPPAGSAPDQDRDPDQDQDPVFLLCLAQGGFPSDWTLTWGLDGFQVSGSGGLEEVSGPGTMMGDGLYSWTSTLKVPKGQWKKVDSVTCEATQGAQDPVRVTLRRDQCQQT